MVGVARVGGRLGLAPDAKGGVLALGEAMPRQEDFVFLWNRYDRLTGRIPTGLRDQRKGCPVIRVSIVGAVVVSCFVSGAYAQQFGSSLTAPSGTQPIPGYSFGAGTLSPNRYATSSSTPKSFGSVSSSGTPSSFSLSSPLTLKASTEPAPLLSFRSTANSTNALTSTVLPTGASLATVGGSSDFTSGAAENDPMRWTSARAAVDSYLGGAAQVRPVMSSPMSSPMSTPSLLVPSGAMYGAPRGVR